MAFADALKDACAAIFGWDRDMLDGKNPQSRVWRTQVDPWWADKLGIPHFTPRFALQNIGTETLRAHFNDSLWIHNVHRRIENVWAKNPAAKIVITDGRFPNELDLVRSLGGQVLRVRRGAEPDWYETACAANHDGDKLAQSLMWVSEVHISEWAWIGHPVDATVENDGTLDDLFRQTDALVDRF